MNLDNMPDTYEEFFLEAMYLRGWKAGRRNEDPEPKKALAAIKKRHFAPSDCCEHFRPKHACPHCGTMPTKEAK